MLQIQQRYRGVLARCQALQPGDNAMRFAEQFHAGLWQDYYRILAPHRQHIVGKVVVDFGCKYGHTAPLFYELGAGRVIGVDVDSDYVKTGRAIFGDFLPGFSIVQSRDGLIPLEPETVDFILINEVVSHVNPGVLPTVWMELGRILRHGGVMFLSDGNNFDSSSCQASLPKVYSGWEHGTTGTDTGRDTVTTSFEVQRARLIQESFPQLDHDEVFQLARWTSGLYGDQLKKVIAEYLRDGELTTRPYRPGMCPTNPSMSGVVMERAFRPVQLVHELEGFGFAAREVRPGYFGWKRRLAWRCVDGLQALSQWLRERLSTENLQILATKKY